jgi:kinesin family protein 11
MAMAVKRRKVAETQMNKMSSRSHTIFTLQIHVKDAQEGDVVRIGKLNLVDLAGSECIGRSGAEKMRAKEAGMINQSLLTLGRVITALVDHTGHIPYRDSKLTRLLQDTLGGHTKTCIIATVSPSSLNVEETLSTLDYAHRAKSIQNTPQVNQKVTPRVMIRGLTTAIGRLQDQLHAAREKSGVRMEVQEYRELQAQTEGQEAEVAQLEERLEVLRKQRTAVEALLAEISGEYAAEQASLEATRVEGAAAASARRRAA